MKFSLHAFLLVVAVALFLYAGVLVDHGDDLWGNSVVLADFGLAAFAASFIPWINSR